MNNTSFWGDTPGQVKLGKIKKSKSPSNGKKGQFFKKHSKKFFISLSILLIFVFAFYMIIGRPAIALASSVKIIKSDFNEIGTSLQNRDLVSMKQAIDKTRTDLDNVRSERDSKFKWAKNFRAFKINEFYSDSNNFINVANYALDALEEMSEIVTPFADAAGLKVSEDQEIVESEGLMEAFQSWISLMPLVADDMDNVILTVSKIGEEIDEINTKKYPEKIGKLRLRENVEVLKGSLSKIDEYAPDIKSALTLLPEVLGVGTPEKRYMIIMQNDKEIRPTGGFMTNYATFKIQNALLQSDFSSKDMYSIDLTLEAIDAVYDFPDAPYPYPELLKVEHWFARDMNYSPDFVSSMDEFLKTYNLAGQVNPYEIKPVNGIFAIDTNVIAELLEVTGPVTVNGITYTEENVVFELERIASLELREQANRKRVLGDLMEAMLVNVFESEKGVWSILIEKGVNLASRKHILIYIIDNPEAQELVDKYRLGGRVTLEPEQDFNMIVSTNLGGDKTNWFVHKDVDMKVEKEGERYLKTVAITYNYVQPDNEYSVFVKRFRDWLRVYAPLGSELVSVEGSQGYEITGNELNKEWWSSYVELGPGEQTTVVYKYYLPEGLIEEGKYTLEIQKQPGIESEHYKIDFLGKTQEIDLSKDTVVVIN